MRAPTSTITDPQISRRHTAVRPVDDGVEVEDLDSLNGTFVNGERLRAPVTLTSSGKIRIGDSDIEVEVEVEVEAADGDGDGMTKMAATPPVEAARGSVKRVDEDAPAAAPAAAGAAAAAAAPPAAAAPAVEQAPQRPAPPRLPEPTDGPPRRRGRGLIWLLAALAIAGGVAAAVYFAQRDDEAAPTKHALVASFRSADLVQGTKSTSFAGTVNQTPGGQGTVLGKFTLKNPYKVGKARKLNGTMVFRFDDGRIDATITGTATRRADKTTDLIITGTIQRGTRAYEGAKGTFKLKSRQEVATVPTVGIGSYEGTITY